MTQRLTVTQTHKFPVQVNVFQALVTLLEGILPCLQPIDEDEEKKRKNAKKEIKYDEDGNEIEETVVYEDPYKNDYEQGWKFMSCSQSQELCQNSTWLLIDYTKVRSLSEAWTAS